MKQACSTEGWTGGGEGSDVHGERQCTAPEKAMASQAGWGAALLAGGKSCTAWGTVPTQSGVQHRLSSSSLALPGCCSGTGRLRMGRNRTIAMVCLGTLQRPLIFSWTSDLPADAAYPLPPEQKGSLTISYSLEQAQRSLFQFFPSHLSYSIILISD